MFWAIRIRVYYFDCFAVLRLLHSRCNYLVYCYLSILIVSIVFRMCWLRDWERERDYASNWWPSEEKCLFLSPKQMVIIKKCWNNICFLFLNGIKCNIDYWDVDTLKCTKTESRQKEKKKDMNSKNDLHTVRTKSTENTLNVLLFFLHIWFAFDSFVRSFVRSISIHWTTKSNTKNHAATA